MNTEAAASNGDGRLRKIGAPCTRLRTGDALLLTLFGLDAAMEVDGASLTRRTGDPVIGGKVSTDLRRTCCGKGAPETRLLEEVLEEFETATEL